MYKIIGWILVIALFLYGGWLLYSAHTTPPTTVVPPQPIAEASYQCNGGNTIHASFFEGTSTPATTPNQPPKPGGSATVVLSDGRTLSLAQTISADGSRYSNGDPNVQGNETFVFWSRGNGALVLENNVEKSFIGCIEVVPDPGNLPQVYESGENGFSLRYPAHYSVDETYHYDNLGPKKSIVGVKFTIDPAVATGTNLSSQSYVSIEQVPQSTNCSASLFVDKGTKVATTTDSSNGFEYSFASTTDAAAGNRYEESVYALPSTNPCIAVRYFIHYGAIENYPVGMVQAFDKASLLAQFDSIRRTLTIVQ